MLQKNTAAVLLILILVFSTAAFSQTEDTRSYTIAVMDLTPNGVSQVESIGLSDKLRSYITQLASEGPQNGISYEVIERAQIDRIFEQFEIQNVGCVSDSCAVEFGKMLQCDRIVIGSVSLIGETYSVTSRLVDIESSRTIKSVDRQHRGAIDDILLQIIPQVGRELITGERTAIASPVSSNSPQEESPLDLTILWGILGKDFSMVSVPAGVFEMGSEDGSRDERPVHRVILDAFAIGNTEITQTQYKAVMGKNPAHNDDDESFPVEDLSWNDAVKFCNKLSELMGLVPCYDERKDTCHLDRNGFRLPTEAEWEYACRAGSTTLYHSGDNETELDAAAWYRENSDGKSHQPGQKEANAWGIFDMHGNVAEWCTDAFGRYDEEASDNPLGEDNDDYRICRGGSFSSKSEDCRTTNRHYYPPRTKDKSIGFRIVWRAEEK